MFACGRYEGIDQRVADDAARRMRVEDVAIPKAEIVAVPDTITKDELVKVFRDSGMTRLPVYSGTLDMPGKFQVVFVYNNRGLEIDGADIKIVRL